MWVWEAVSKYLDSASSAPVEVEPQLSTMDKTRSKFPEGREDGEERESSGAGSRQGSRSTRDLEYKKE